MIDKRMMFAAWSQVVATEVCKRSNPKDTKRILILCDRAYVTNGERLAWVLGFLPAYTAAGGYIRRARFEGASTFSHAVDMVLAFPCNSRDDASARRAFESIPHTCADALHIIREGTTYLTWRNWAEHRAVNRMQRRRRKKERRDDNRWLTRPECPKRVMKQLEQTFTPWEI